MKLTALLTIAATGIATCTAAPTANLGKLIFSDDFNRNESQETSDEIGNDWGSNSKSRAKGNKQVDLRDGAMYIYIHKEADHAVSVTHSAEFKDGSVEMRFMLENADDSLGLDMADMALKEVHAGHLFIARVSSKDVLLIDHKTGGMNMAIYEAKKEKKLTPEQTKQLKEKQKSFPNKLEIGKWHTLLMTVKGDTLSAAIDGREVASFASEGFAHPTKKMLRLSVPKNAVVDDVKIYAQSE